MNNSPFLGLSTNTIKEIVHRKNEERMIKISLLYKICHELQTLRDDLC